MNKLSLMYPKLQNSLLVIILVFSKDAINRVVAKSVHENKCEDPFEEHIGQSKDIGIETKDKIDKPLRGYLVTRLNVVFKKEDPEEFFALLEQA